MSEWVYGCLDKRSLKNNTAFFPSSPPIHINAFFLLFQLQLLSHKTQTEMTALPLRDRPKIGLFKLFNTNNSNIKSSDFRHSYLSEVTKVETFSKASLSLTLHNRKAVWDLTPRDDHPGSSTGGEQPALPKSKALMRCRFWRLYLAYLKSFSVNRDLSRHIVMVSSLPTASLNFMSHTPAQARTTSGGHNGCF